ncbi:hypothetical protein PAMA_020661 [Pampus argenteus]
MQTAEGEHLVLTKKKKESSSHQRTTVKSVGDKERSMEVEREEEEKKMVLYCPSIYPLPDEIKKHRAEYTAAFFTQQPSTSCSPRGADTTYSLLKCRSLRGAQTHSVTGQDVHLQERGKHRQRERQREGARQSSRERQRQE